MKEALTEAIAAACSELFSLEVIVELIRPEEQFGDYATNVALQLAQQLQRPPLELAQQLAGELQTRLKPQAEAITVASPGFLNITLNDTALAAAAVTAPGERLDYYRQQVIVTEYSDPNPFKVLHIGHLYTSIVGDSITNIIEKGQGKAHRTNFGGDVGLHVAKAMWAIIRVFDGEYPDKLSDILPEQQASWLSARYVEGNTAYEADEGVKQEIREVNKRIYDLHDHGDHESAFARIYWTCRQWSYDYFEAFYARIGTKFEKYYPESSVAPLGIQIIREQLAKGVYQESNGAVVFKGEPYGLHTRVFINSQGLPTYEAKDVGLILAKWRDYHFDRSVIITGNDITEYMKVVVKSIEQFEPKLAKATTHIVHGNVKMRGGIKMSSRKGNVLLAADVLDAVNEATARVTGKRNEQAALAAVKYAFLKQRIGQDVIYNAEESVSLDGNSGPYIQYAHARARSILRKVVGQSPEAISSLDPGERTLARKLTVYPEILLQAMEELLPHYICTYLYELAQVFNHFYEYNRVIDHQRQDVRLQLVRAYADTLKSGLALLGISAPDTM